MTNKKLTMLAVALVVVIGLAIGWIATGGYGLSGNSGSLDSSQQESSDSSRSAGPEVNDPGTTGPEDLPAYKRKGVPSANFEGLDDTNGNAVILSFVNVIYNTEVAATDSPTNNALRAKGLMTTKLAQSLEDSESDQPPSARWVNWGNHKVVLRAEFTLNQQDFPKDTTNCPKASSTEPGRCIFVSGGEQTNSSSTSIQRIILVRQWKQSGTLDIPESRLIVRVSAVRNSDNSWRVSAFNAQAIN